jgi:hypothetical protein
MHGTTVGKNIQRNVFSKMLFASQAHIIFRIIKGTCSNCNANIYLISFRVSQSLAAPTAYPGLEQDSFINVHVFRRTLRQNTLMCFIMVILFV